MEAIGLRRIASMIYQNLGIPWEIQGTQQSIDPELCKPSILIWCSTIRRSYSELVDLHGCFRLILLHSGLN